MCAKARAARPSSMPAASKAEVDAVGGEIERDIPFLTASTVFNCEQIEGLPDHYHQRPEPPADPLVRIEHADRFLANTGAVIPHGGSKAFYAPSSDRIQMPELQSVRDAESYVAVLGHECEHWAGAPHRLNRGLSRYHKDLTERAREELIADIGASFLCADLGIVPEHAPRPDHASYVASWLKLLDGDRRAIFQAAAHAQRAVAYLHDLQPRAASELDAA